MEIQRDCPTPWKLTAQEGRQACKYFIVVQHDKCLKGGGETKVTQRRMVSSAWEAWEKGVSLGTQGVLVLSDLNTRQQGPELPICPQIRVPLGALQ